MAWAAYRACGSRISIVGPHAEMNTPFDGSHDAANLCYIENSPAGNATRIAVASPHVGGAHLLLADGAVKFVSENIESNPLPGSAGGNVGDYLYQNLFGIEDGNAIGAF